MFSTAFVAVSNNDIKSQPQQQMTKHKSITQRNSGTKTSVRRKNSSSTNDVKDKRSRKISEQKPPRISHHLTPNWIYDLKPGEVDCPCLIHCASKQRNTKLQPNQEIKTRKYSLDSNLGSRRSSSKPFEDDSIRSRRSSSIPFEEKASREKESKVNETRSIGIQTDPFVIKTKSSLFKKKSKIIF